MTHTALALNSYFSRVQAILEPIKDGPRTSHEEKLIKIGASVVRHRHLVCVQMAMVAIPMMPFGEILRRVVELWPPLDPPPM